MTSHASTPNKPLSLAEFVLLLAFMISILALSIDAMLPALDDIARDFELENPNDAQLVISSMFLGFAFGQIAAGPLSDCFGRKPIIYLGYIIFITGCLISMVTDNYTLMLVGRVLQGLGAAAPRIVGIALVRDGYEGRSMARIMSIVMAIFIIVPAIAPAIGQGILTFAEWPAIFGMLLVVAVLAFIWFALRQPETLKSEDTRVFTFTSVWLGIVEAFSYRALTGYMICSGLIFGAFVGYLNSAQQIFEDIYQTGDLFAIYFGIAALAIGVSSVINSLLVMKYGMRYLSQMALIALSITSLMFFIYGVLVGGVPDFWTFMTWLLVAFFCLGILIGNFNAMAMEPVGYMAGLGAAVNGAFSTFISLPFGWAIGAAYNETILPLVGGFAVLSFATLFVMAWTERGEG
jgi:DHA1 family bicyclomycin/chloramphenicol resistance-like MFS transporter